MCTVSYVPLEEGFILTSNRDEMKGRPASLPPEFYETADGISLYYPQDPVGKGTWIAVSEDERVVCLLNGAFRAHTHRPPYNRSRGLIALEAFRFETPFDFYKGIPLEGVEPFTLVLVWSEQLYEFRWDGRHKFLLSLPRAPYLWASSTLYTDQVLSLKKEWLHSWLQSEQAPSQQGLFDFHENGGIADPLNGMKIDRPNGLATVSITSVQVRAHEVSMLQKTSEGKWFEDEWQTRWADESWAG